MSNFRHSNYDEVDEEDEEQGLGHDEEEQKGLTKLIGSPNTGINNGSSSIAGNGSAFGGSGIQEGMEVEEEEEDVEIDSDIENELPHDEEQQHRAPEIEQEQKCGNYFILYVIGIITCLACEFLILLPAFYLRLFVVGLLYIVILLSLSSCALHMQICPGKRQAHSHLALAMYVAAFAAYIGGMGGAYYYKQAWYFDRMDTAYANVKPHVDPKTGLDYTSVDTYMTKQAEPIDITPTFLEFEYKELKLPDNPDQETGVTAFVMKYSALDGSVVVGAYKNKDDGHTYCASAIMATNAAAGTKKVWTYNVPSLFYWAVGVDCCTHKEDSRDGQFKSWCPYWGTNVPVDKNTKAAFYTDFSAEVLPEYSQDDTNYRAAIARFWEPAGVNATHLGNPHYLVTVMTLQDHYGLQTQRRNKAYTCLFTAAILWPILLLIFLGLWTHEDAEAAFIHQQHHILHSDNEFVESVAACLSTFGDRDAYMHA